MSMVNNDSIKDNDLMLFLGLALVAFLFVFGVRFTLNATGCINQVTIYDVYMAEVPFGTFFYEGEIDGTMVLFFASIDGSFGSSHRAHTTGISSPPLSWLRLNHDTDYNS